MSYKIEHFFPSKDALGEGVFYDAATRSLYWINIPTGGIHKYVPSTGLHKYFEVGQPMGVAVQRAKGGLLVALKSGFAFLDERSKRVDLIVKTFEEENARGLDYRLNDGAVDVKGRLWCGSMADGTTDKNVHSGALYRLDPDGSLHTIPTGLDHIKIPNGLGWSPDNTIFYMSDSMGGRIYAWDFDAEAGTIANPRMLHDLNAEGYEPDGMSVDVEGCLWWAQWGGSKVIRFSPDGTILSEIPIPAERVTCVGFGGPSMDELYVTTAQPEESEKDKWPLAGDVFKIKVGVKGLPKYKFAG